MKVPFYLVGLEKIHWPRQDCNKRSTGGSMTGSYESCERRIHTTFWRSCEQEKTRKKKQVNNIVVCYHFKISNRHHFAHLSVLPVTSPFRSQPRMMVTCNVPLQVFRGQQFNTTLILLWERTGEDRRSRRLRQRRGRVEKERMAGVKGTEIIQKRQNKSSERHQWLSKV